MGMGNLKKKREKKRRGERVTKGIKDDQTDNDQQNPKEYQS